MKKEKSDKKRVLVVGDTLSIPTGLGYVAGSFARKFMDNGEYEVAYAVMTNATINNNNIRAIDEIATPTKFLFFISDSLLYK